MQGPKRRTPSTRRVASQVSKGRVIDLRSWKAQKRLQNLRGRRPWSFYILTVLAVVLAGFAAISALVSCIPSGFQIHGIVLTWFFAALGVVLGITLHILGERTAKRLLLVDMIAMAVALVAAIMH